ncbi:MAG: hypothetical protein IIZ59_04135 [Clostridia bacterium]|nr:hypothetical protein [Clostridia bacterium]
MLSWRGIFYYFTDFVDKEYFGEQYAELLRPCLISDRIRLRDITAKIDEAFSCVEYDSYEDAVPRFGEELAWRTQHRPETVSEWHTLTVITGHISGDNAVLWIKYSDEGYDIDGNLTHGSWDILTRFTAEKQNGEWVVTDSKEHP